MAVNETDKCASNLSKDSHTDKKNYFTKKKKMICANMCSFCDANRKKKKVDSNIK